MQPSSIVILTGAGISVESAIASFRDSDGIWARLDWRDYATPDAFAAHPARVYGFYNKRRRQLHDVGPNAAHYALARLERECAGSVTLITQNVDDLHESAGSQNLIHMHGELRSALCRSCHSRNPWLGDMSIDSRCPSCEAAGRLRPDIVWFGEMPYHMDRIYQALASADLFIAIGTSGAVYPAADFVEEARLNGAHTVMLNLEAPENSHAFDEIIHGNATEIVPAYVDKLIGSVPL